MLVFNNAMHGRNKVYLGADSVGKERIGIAKVNDFDIKLGPSRN